MFGAKTKGNTQPQWSNASLYDIQLARAYLTNTTLYYQIADCQYVIKHGRMYIICLYIEDITKVINI